MDDLQHFSEAVRARLAAARRAPDWQPAQTAEFMAARAPRRLRFEEVASRLVRTLIRPRIEIVAASFPNATADRNVHENRCAYWFGYCERFPADAKVEIAVEHDQPIESIFLHFELSIMPVFLKFEPHEKITMSLDAVDDQVAARWVESVLLSFLDTYLCLDRGLDDFDDEVVVDPVCGMRLNRSSAKAQAEYRGHPYFFCTEDCRQQFDKEPLRYVEFKID